jgi:RNA polymerase sigma-70 factor, ECF subfamily
MASTVSEHEQTDEQLAAAAARRGDADGDACAASDAFESLYRRHAPLLLAFIAARCRPAEREDMLQEVWRRVWQHLPKQFHGGNFRAWLYQIARHALIDHNSKKKPELLNEPEIVPDGRPDWADALLQREHSDALRRCVEKLTENAAAVVRARLTGEDYADVCQRLGITHNQAYKLFHSAKDQLKNCLERALG